ncbi:zinc finger CCHC-type and RNA-binding motif-containing protein 1-like, partial [Tachysurus ichikawai]
WRLGGCSHTVNGIWVKGSHVTVTPLPAPATRINVSNVPPFVSNDAIIKENLQLQTSSVFQTPTLHVQSCVQLNGATEEVKEPNDVVMLQ